jgi:heme exporter protein B
MSLFRAAGAVFRRDLALTWAQGGPAAPVGFFVGAVTLLPLAMGADRTLIAMVGPPLLWVSAALAALMTLERLFQADLEDGSLDQLLLSTAPMELIAAAKGAALYVGLGLPLVAAGAVLSLTLQTPPAAAPVVALGLALGMAAFIGLGLIGAAVAAGVRRGGVLVAVLVLPFFAPPIIFGAAAASEAARGGEAFPAAFLFLAACAAGGAVIGPIGAAAALRLQAE